LTNNSIVKSSILSRLLRVLLGLSCVALVVLMFYIYQAGLWKEILSFYRVFFDPKRLRIFVSSFGPFGAIAFMLVQALQVVFAPVPGEITGFVGGFLFGRVWGTIYSTIGLCMGSLLAYGISRTFGMKAVEKVVKKEYIDKFNYFVTHQGLSITFVLFLIPGFPKDSLCYLLGLTHMRFVDFLFMNLVGRLPGTMILSFQGSAIKEGHYQEFFILLFVTIVIIVVLYVTRNHIIRFFGRVLRLVFRKKKDKKGYADPVIGEDV
jgi:uncharacterized membrane protein YdjX (TVP38/TMEM64 family)